MKERKNVYKLPEGDKTLEWYGRAVIEMKKRPTTDPGSWNYQAAMHNIDENSPFWNGAGPFVGRAEWTEFWDQCQHGSWFFLPWHRMYLAWFEDIVAKTISGLGGPPDWALPFWDYSDASNPNALTIPAAFTDPALATNGLWIPGRIRHTLRSLDVSLKAAMDAPSFSGTGRTALTGFGGGETSFANHGNEMGQLENQPHGSVHIAINGAMGNPFTAALDPIFWLHHANIDRLWQVWLNAGNRINPVKSSWLDFTFEFHDKDGNKVEKKCSEVLDTRKVLAGYTYQDVDPTVPAEPEREFRIIKTPDFSMPLEIVAATNKKVTLGSEKTVVRLKLTPSPKKRTNFALISKPPEKPPTTILHFENVTGKGIPPTQDIYLNVPDNEGSKESYYAGSISLFGVKAASTPSLHNSGSGQHYSLDITELMNRLRTLANWKEKQLDVSIEPAWEMDKDASVKIGRISLYSE